MSYNIDSYRIKKLENFRIPLKAFTKEEFVKDYDFDTQEIKIESKISEVGEFNGIVIDNTFVELTKISIYGEGSGYFMATVGDNLLKNSTGTLVATVVWEDGDEVERVKIIDGIVKTKKLN